MEFFIWRLVATTGILIVLAGVLGQWTLPPNATAWGLVILAGTMDVAVSRTLYYVSLRRLTVSIHALIFTLSPVVAIGWALALFGSRRTLREGVGGVIVLIGVAIVNFRKK